MESQQLSNYPHISHCPAQVSAAALHRHETRKTYFGPICKKNSIKTTSTEQLSLEPVSIIIWER